jgi:hypothetical protein
MRFGSWNVRSLYRAGLLKVVASELAKYNLDLVALERSGVLRFSVNQQTILHFYMEMRTLIIS